MSSDPGFVAECKAQVKLLKEMWNKFLHWTCGIHPYTMKLFAEECPFKPYKKVMEKIESACERRGKTIYDLKWAVGKEYSSVLYVELSRFEDKLVEEISSAGRSEGADEVGAINPPHRTVVRVRLWWD